MEKKKKKKLKTINYFLKDKDKLLTAFGIFLALTLYTNDVETPELNFLGENSVGDLLSFVFFSCTMILWLELWSSFPSKKRSWTLIVFENLINIGSLILVIFYFISYYEKGKLFFVIWAAAGVGYILVKIAEKLKVFQTLKRSIIWKYKFVRFFVGLIFISIYSLIAIFCGFAIIYFIDLGIAEIKL